MLINLIMATLMMLVTPTLHIAGLSFVLMRLKANAVPWRDRRTFVRAYKLGEIVVILFFLSVVEIMLWVGLYLLVGAIEQMEAAFYFSTVSFTTLGYGDVVLDGKWRLMSSFEAANGIIIFGLTTAAVVAAAQRLYLSNE